MVHTGPFHQMRFQLVLWRHTFSDFVKKVKIESHVQSYMLQTKLRLKIRLLLDVGYLFNALLKNCI